MPNVDLCVREAENGLCGNIELHAKNIEKIPDENRAKVFRKKNKEQISQILLKCANSIRSHIISLYYKNDKVKLENIILTPESNDNKIGADLKHQLPSNKMIGIEVKFGEETNKNIGMKVFDKIFGCSFFTDTLSSSQRQIWQELYFKTENKTEQLDRLHNALNQSIEQFNKFQKEKNCILSPSEQQYMEDIIINNSGNGEKKYDEYMKFVLNGDDFDAFATYPTKVGCWTVNEVDKLSNDKKRVNVFVNNCITNLKIKYTLNWKNTYKSAKYLDKKADAKLGLGTSNWNVWITAKVLQL